jgi:hypothetical protein
MVDTVQVSGLSEARTNMLKLKASVQAEILNAALRDMGWELARPMRGQTYSTFIRRTGAIQHGLSVAVERDAKSNQLKAWVVEYPQSIAGAETPFKALVRKHMAGSHARKVSTTSTAFWWRFLEKGTGERKSVRTPRATKVPSQRAGTRSAKAWGRWTAASSHGRLVPRPWLAPAFDSSAQLAIATFRASFLKLVDAATSAMPKR